MQVATIAPFTNSLPSAFTTSPTVSIQSTRGNWTFGRVALSSEELGAVETKSFDLDENLAVLKARHGNLLNLQGFGAAGGVDDRCLHCLVGHCRQCSNASRELEGWTCHILLLFSLCLRAGGLLY